MTFKTEQEAFWAGSFGDEYILRNNLSPQVFAGTVNLWSSVLGRMPTKPTTVLELGSNIGNQLRALNALLPEAELSGVEINANAAEQLRQWRKAHVYETSIQEFKPSQVYDLVYTSGVLIHISPDDLAKIYETMYSASGKYICMAEYYSPRPEEISYRGHSEKMYRRDFAGEIMEMYPDLALQGYGFVYHKDPIAPLGDLTWFLLEKR